MTSAHDRITILHLRCSNYVGGPETSLLGWHKYMNRKRFDCQMLFFRERHGLHHRSLEVFAEHDVPVTLIPWGLSKNLPGALTALSRLARAHRPAILHAHDVRSDFVALIVGRLTGTPVVVSNHAWHAVGLKRMIFEGLRGKWLRWADMVVNVSADTCAETIRRGVPPERSITIYSGLDLAPYRAPPGREAVRASLGLEPTDLVVSNVARMWPEKALHVLVDAAARLVPKYPALRVVQVGDGVLMDALRADVEKRGIQNNFRFLGFRKDYLNVMAASDIFALPSAAEGTPMVIYSAMALGLPIVASAVSGVGELLVDEETALLIGPADPDGLTTALDRLLADPALGRRIGVAARAEMEANYSAEVAVRRFEHLYESLVARRRGQPALQGAAT
jgi:glycosyltransferase involved in cell wall biosynthesis